ncbi:hypothetical protein SAMN05216354_0727 [Xylanibacter ruminicola]|uniref:Uncharacterized protein n=1 Tax=Xylanibacter ruminicola TaxID=839 RepID=A0A1H5SY32_XYLRU|nr:hypothetical protein SAMN05216354_0727 [Xylanibacter ruminicola]
MQYFTTLTHYNNRKGIILLIIKIWKRESYYGWSQY